MDKRMQLKLENAELAAKLKGSLLLFIQVFFPILTGREFIISRPTGRESHFITICRALTKCTRLESLRLLINVPPGHGKPLCKTTRVLVSDGTIKLLGEIKIGDMIYTHKGRFRRVNQIFEQGVLPTLKISTFGGREVIAAHDHSFLTAKGWLKAHELKVDDVLAIASPTEEFGSPMIAEEARLLGYFIGDGSTSQNSCSITACDLIGIEDIKHCIETMGFKYNLVSYDLNGRPKHHSKNTTRINVVDGGRNWLRNHDVAGKNSYTKRVPKCIFLSDFESIRNFLGAYFACDGTFGHKEQGRRDFSGSVTSVSRELLEDCQHLLMRLGIRSRIRKKVRNQKTKKQGETYTSYNLEITSQDDMYNFQKQVGPYIYHEKAKLLNEHDFLRRRFDSQLMPDQITSIEDNGYRDCMCIEVDEDHTFTANDIVVHNSVIVSFWIAWCYAKWPDCNFLYVSYSKTLATNHTETIKRIMSLSQYITLFGVKLREDSQAKDSFTTEAGGTVASFGSAGAITGRNAGLPGLNRFSGGVLLDDMHKPDEVGSDLIRESVISNFRETIQQRPRGVNVPIVFIGQRLHEMDLPAYFLSGEDGYQWDNVVLKSIDEAGNALYPEAFPLDMLKIRQQKDRYVFAAQHQQDPQPAGGGLYVEEDFPVLDEDPNFYMTFITADTAETEDPRNDATVFSFWGMYNIEVNGNKTGVMALHWIGCREIRVEPKKLEKEFLDFWGECCKHKNPPLMAFIEKKSTGVTLISILKGMRGLKIREIERTRRSGSKSQRFIDIQPYIANKQVSLPTYGSHTQMCITHMKKITNNDSHAHDDIADTCADAVRIALIDKSLSIFASSQNTSRQAASVILNRHSNVIHLKNRAYRIRD